MDENKPKRRFDKTFKAFDWLISCLIRLPILVTLVGIVIIITFFVLMIVKTDVAFDILRMLGVYA